MRYKRRFYATKIKILPANLWQTAVICDECAESCDGFEEDFMKECASVCRRCAESCREMAR